MTKATTTTQTDPKSKRCMKCGRLFETRGNKCPYCGGKLTDNKPGNNKQYLAD